MHKFIYWWNRKVIHRWKSPQLYVKGYHHLSWCCCCRRCCCGWSWYWCFCSSCCCCFCCCCCCFRCCCTAAAAAVLPQLPQLLLFVVVVEITIYHWHEEPCPPYPLLTTACRHGEPCRHDITCVIDKIFWKGVNINLKAINLSDHHLQ